MLKKLKKLKQVSLAELFERTKQGSHLLAERLGVSSQVGLPNDTQFFRLLKNKNLNSGEKLLEHFRTRHTPKAFPSFENIEETVAELRRRFPAHEHFIIKRADKICRGEFDLLGFENLRFESEPPALAHGLEPDLSVPPALAGGFSSENSIPDWHYEPIAKIKSPKIHWSKIEEISAEATGDKKIIWELNRHQYFATLGQAYLYTKDEKYAKTFAAHLENWLTENPPKLGVNWLSSLELAFRAMSWLWAIYFFRDSPAVTPELFLWMLKSLNAHAKHIETYLSTYFSPNTHLTGEALGLYFLGTLLPEFKEAGNWKTTGEKILLDALNWQIRDDGVYVEQATAYHRYTTDFYTQFLWLKKINSENLDGSTKLNIDEQARLDKALKKLEKAFDFLLSLTLPDGLIPLVGDDDGGRFVFLDEMPNNDFRPTLANGAILFERGDLKFVAENPTAETLWLFGPNKLRKFDEIEAKVPKEPSKSFTQSGFYVMSDGKLEDSNYLLIDCGPHGFMNAGHAHADALSFVLAVKGKATLIDSGTYVYTADKELRNYFRSSQAHNTLTVDDQSSSQPDGPFSWKSSASASVLNWHSDEHFDFFAGSHNGYSSLGVLYIRQFLFLKNNYWIMVDTLTGDCVYKQDKFHNYKLHFHFAPDAEPDQDLKIETFAVNQPFSQAKGGWKREEGYVSMRYGSKQLAPKLTYTLEQAKSVQLVTFLYPADLQAEISEIKAAEGSAFLLKTADFHDIFLLNHHKNRFAITQNLTSDFEQTWARYSAENDEILELALVDGHRWRIGDGELNELPLNQKFGYRKIN